MTVPVTETTNSVATEPLNSQVTEQSGEGLDSTIVNPANAKEGEANQTEPDLETANGNQKESFLGQVRKAESLIKEGKEVPNELKWTLAHVDPETLKTEAAVEPTKEEDFEKMYQKRKEKEDYEHSMANLKAEYDDETSTPIQEKIESLVANNNMGHMEAFDLVTGGLEPSKRAKLTAQRRSQTLPNRNDVSEEPNMEGYDDVASAYKAQTGRTITKNAYKLGKEAGLY